MKTEKPGQILDSQFQKLVKNWVEGSLHNSGLFEQDFFGEQKFHYHEWVTESIGVQGYKVGSLQENLWSCTFGLQLKGLGVKWSIERKKVTLTTSTTRLLRVK